jgi:hypothetical protein
MTNRKVFSLVATWALIGVTLLISSIQSSAQPQEQSAVGGKTKADEHVIKCFQSYIVQVDVRDQRGRPVSDLRKDDFIVYEDGVRQELVLWKRNEGADVTTHKSMYEAGYYPMNSRFAGQFRKIRVAVRTKGNGRLKVEFSPKGYYAKKELIK